jgi:serine/threonine-protein kinase
MPAGLPLRIGKYEVESELGRGGFGRVYKAFDPTVNRPVAIKILTELDSPELLARFKTEASATGNLHHPNIVTIYEFGMDNNSPYLVMEYLEGQDLQQVIAARQPLSLLEKVRIMAQVAQGLHSAHRNLIVHRDVKPSNIRVLPNGEVKVMDFGIARLLQQSNTRLTRQGDMIGTIKYMAPEQFHGVEADALCDIFAYGLVFYELLSGKNPFEASDSRTMMYKLVSEQPAPLSETAPDCPPALEHIVMRALEKAREDRYQSLEDLLLDLQPVVMSLQKARAEELLHEARGFFNSGEIVQVEPILRNSLELDPMNPEAKKLRAQLQQALRQMSVRLSVRSQIEANLKAVDDQIARGLLAEASLSMESALRMYPNEPEFAKRLEQVRQLQNRARAQARVPEESPRPAKDTEQTGGLKADLTVLVDSKGTDLPPWPEESSAQPVREFTEYFGKPELDGPLHASITILSCPDSFREGETVPIRSSSFTIGRIDSDLQI